MAVGAVGQVKLRIKDGNGQVRGQLIVKILPQTGGRGGGTLAPLVDETDNPDRDPFLEPVQLLEGEEYLYRIVCFEPATVVTTDQESLFHPDNATGKRGRLRPGLYTGTVEVRFFVGDHELGTTSFEVRSRKVDYLTQYRWMLRDIAEAMTELIMESFTPSEQRFVAGGTQDAATLYQRFAFLRSIILDEALEDAIICIVNRPHRAWVEASEWRRPSQLIPSSSSVARQLTRPGPRIGGDVGTGVIRYPLPAKLEAVRTRETLDTEPNRFVRFALQQWRWLVEDISQALQATGVRARRAHREIQAVLDRLDSYLMMTDFPELSPLTRFPIGNTVLQRGEGYRTILQLYLQVEMAARLSWSGGDEVYRAGQRDIATLYEYWVYLQLAAIVARLSGGKLDHGSLIYVSERGLTVDLRKGREHVIQGSLERLGRRLRLEFWFNRVFSPQRGGSWTRAMRPDFSLRIVPEDEGASYAETWIHFDTKYRVETITQLFGASSGTVSDGLDSAPVIERHPADGQVSGAADAVDERQDFGDAEDVKTGRPLRADLLKMHAYKDAIRRSSGAYVIYPGIEEERRVEFHEILPGLGAFPLRPTKDGLADGSDVLTGFIEDVMLHVASQVTQHERELYWVTRAYTGTPPALPIRAAEFLSKPPADTPVLLGYVRDEAHLAWIEASGRYDLQVDGTTGSVGWQTAQLGAEFVVLYGPPLLTAQVWRVVDGPQVMTRKRMEKLGYPGPHGEVYICLPIEPVMGEWATRLTTENMERLRAKEAPDASYGAPVMTTWLGVVTGSGKS